MAVESEQADLRNPQIGHDVNELRTIDAALARLAAEPALRPQYCQVVDAETLRPVDQVTPGRTVLAVAGHLGATRLIDNADLG